MAFFGGRRMFRPASGAGAGRGDNPHFKPVAMGSVPPAVPGTPGAVGGPPAPTPPRLKIGGDSAGATSNPVPNTRAARKANSPKRKAKALKNVPSLGVPTGDAVEDRFKPVSDAGFIKSEPAHAYDRARAAEGRIADAEKKEPWDRGKYNVRGPRQVKGTSNPFKPSKEEWIDNPDPRSPMERDQDTVSAYTATGQTEFNTAGRAHVEAKGTEAQRKRRMPYG